MKFHNRRYLFLKFRDIDKMSLCMLFADLRLEGTTLGSIDPIPGENIRDGDTYGDGGDYQRGIQAVHAGSPHLFRQPLQAHPRFANEL